MKPTDAQVWLGIGAMLLAAGMWLGALQQRVKSLEEKQTYVHGDLAVPSKRN
jgi:hypothetical protein